MRWFNTPDEAVAWIRRAFDATPEELEAEIQRLEAELLYLRQDTNPRQDKSPRQGTDPCQAQR